MKTIKKRLSVVLLSVFMVFGVVSSDYLTVNAFEWVVPSLSFAESLGWLFGSLGMAYQGVESWDTVAPEYEDDFKEYALEHGLNYEETTSWMDEVGNGRLNQASQVWEKFKAWASSLLSDNSSFNLTCSDVILNEFSNVSNVETHGHDFIFSYGFKYVDGNNTFYLFFPDTCTFRFGEGYIEFNSSVSTSYLSNSVGIHSTTTSVDLVSKSLTSNYTKMWLSSTREYYFYNIDFPVSSNFFNWDLSFEDNESVFVSLSPESIKDFSLALQNAISSAIPDVIPLPWDNVGDNTQAINDKMDELLEKVASGTLSIEAFMEAVQTLLGVFTVDTTADDVLVPEKPNPDTDEPQKLEDEVAKNKSNSGFVLCGLENVFPFCIPFDLYAFITLLEAPPVAPVIQYPIYNPITDSNEIITIDFSTWESVVVLFRYIFDFLFIVGLLLIARALIGGGDSA